MDGKIDYGDDEDLILETVDECLSVFDHFWGLRLKGQFPAWNFVRGSQHRKALIHHEQCLNLHKIWIQILLNKVV